MGKRVQGYTRSDGTKVKGYSRKGKSSKTKRYTPAQQRAFEKSKTSNSGRKTWRQRQKTKRPGLWSNFHAKKHREKLARKR